MSGRGSKHRSGRRDGGTGSSGRDVYQAPSYQMPNRTKDVVEHARRVQRDLSSVSMENKRHEEKMDQEAYTNRFMHLILDHLADWEGEDYLSSFMNNCHLEDRAQHKTQKAIKAFIEEFLDDVVQVIHSPGESAGQYSIRMRTVDEDSEDKDGSNGGKSDSEEEKRPSKSRRRGRRSGSR
jgi:hypothetical protein